MKKKEIIILHDFTKSGLDFKENQRYCVHILKIEVVGYMNRYPEDNTMEGASFWSALVEFDNGKIMSFDIDFEIHIVGDAE
ncbi:MAG: hypothetical protein LBC68_10935 [Prevotellaceae bacterium]|jgi:hypothetical protein|nr:hypothetical protein [Prevotellaceae bacterium]